MPPEGIDHTPANPEAEARILGTAINYPETTSIITAALEPQDFFLDKHRTLFTIIGKMLVEGEPVDDLTVATRYAATGGAMSDVLALPADGLSQAHLAHHLDLVKRESARRSLRHLFMRLQARAVDPLVDPREVMAEAVQGVGGIVPGTGNGHVIGWDIHKFLNYAMGEPDWIAEPFISRGDVAFLTADAGVGKTWLLLSLALQAAIGEPWLGKFRTRATKVLYLDFENHKRGDSLRRRLLQLCHAQEIAAPWAEIPAHGLTIVTRHDMPGALDLYRGTGVREFVAEVKTRGYELVIVDSFVCVHGAQSENDASQMGKVMNVLRSIGSETDCALVLAHHSRKPGANAPDIESHQSYRGSTAIKGGADCMIELSVEKQGTGETPTILRLRHTKHRHVVQLRDMAVSLTNIDENKGTRLTVEEDSMLITLKKDLCKNWLLKGLWELDNLEKIQGYVGQKTIQERAGKLGYGSPVVIRDGLRELGAEGKLSCCKGKELGLTAGPNGVYWKLEKTEEQETFEFWDASKESGA